MFHQHKAPAYINSPGSLPTVLITKVKNLIRKLQENYGFKKQINLLKKSLKAFNKSMLNKNPVFSFVRFVSTAQDNSQ